MSLSSEQNGCILLAFYLHPQAFYGGERNSTTFQAGNGD
jgi:hypothetical protein